VWAEREGMRRRGEENGLRMGGQVGLMRRHDFSDNTGT
jgi:hypothetical protein